MGSIEDIILGDDRRGIGELRRHLAPDYCRQAAKFLLDTPGAALIATGFYIHAAAPETDGPPAPWRWVELLRPWVGGSPTFPIATLCPC